MLFDVAQSTGLTALKMVCNSKMVGLSVKRIEVWASAILVTHIKGQVLIQAIWDYLLPLSEVSWGDRKWNYWLCDTGNTFTYSLIKMISITAVV